MVGNQEPRIKIEPDRVDTDGKGAFLLMQKYGCTLDEWQRLVLDCWLGVDSSGNYTMTSGFLSLARQNGKNVIIEARELYGLIVNGEKILHTAHLLKTSKKAFYRLVAIFENTKYPELNELVADIRRTNGEETIQLKNGGIIEYGSRSKQTARGFDGISLIVFDEAQDLEDNQLEAIMSTLSASSTGTRQIIYAGTPPYPDCAGTVFKRSREKILSGTKNEHNAWHEWSIECENMEDFDIMDKSFWYQCNPSLPKRLTEEFTTEEARTLSKDGFMRERLGWWAPTMVHSVEVAIDPVKWMECKSDDPKPEGKTAYGVKFSADGSEVCLCGAVIPQTGKPRISLIARENTGIGLNWLAKWLNERVKIGCCVVIDGRNGVDVLIDKISGIWVFKNSIIKPNVEFIIGATGYLVNSLAENNLTWFSGQEDLSNSAGSAVKRPIGKAWTFGGANSLPIEACALALYGCKQSKRNPQRVMRLG